MKQTNKAGWAVNTPLSKNEYKISAQTADLTAFCELLNTTIAGLVKGGFLELKSVTNAMVIALANFDAAPIVEVVEKAYTDEATKIKFERAKRDFLKGKDNAANDIQAAVDEMGKQYQRKAVKYYKPSEGGYWRLRYLQVENGFVSFNRALLIEDNTEMIRSKQHEAFLQRANDLYTKIIAFNDECKRLSDGAVTGIDFVSGCDALITINESGECIFDASLTSNMEFE